MISCSGSWFSLCAPIPATARPAEGGSRPERFAEACALQQRKRNLRDFSEPLRDVNQPPLWVGLPKPIAGVFLKFLEQQRDSLGLTFELQLRPQIVEKQFAVRYHVAGDRDGVNQRS